MSFTRRPEATATKIELGLHAQFAEGNRRAPVHSEAHTQARLSPSELERQELSDHFPRRAMLGRRGL
jgi:hypothetical protein